MLLNFTFKPVPRPLTTEMMAIEMPAAIKPYSMAVAPDSSLRKRRSRKRIIGISRCPFGTEWISFWMLSETHEFLSRGAKAIKISDY